MKLVTLKTSAEFRQVRGGDRWSTAAFVMEGKPRSGAATGCVDQRVARFGFTVTKKLGNAVTRNRIRRRLKAAVASLATEKARPGFDYVVVARTAALENSFAQLCQHVRDALERIGGRPAKSKTSAVDKRSRADGEHGALRDNRPAAGKDERR